MDEESLFTVTLEQAAALFAQPKLRGRAAAAPPLKELGNDPVSGAPMVVKEGRFGPYVTDGETNASLRKDDSIEELTDERAVRAARRPPGARPGEEEGARPQGGQEGAGQEGARRRPAPKKKAAPKAT